MNRRLIINGVLAAAVIAIGVTLWLTRAPAPTPIPTISDIPVHAIHRIEIHHGRDLVVLRRKNADSTWRMVTPVAGRPDPVHVAAMLQLARTIPTHDYKPQGIADKITGLAKPRLVVRFNDEAPIAIGHSGPAPQTRYVRTAHALLLASTAQLDGLEYGWSEWLDPALLPPAAQLTRLILPRYTLAPNDNGDWQVQPAASGRNATDAKATIQAWRRVKALAVTPADTSRQRIARITLEFSGLPTRHLDVIERSPNLILRNPRLGVDYQLAGNRVGPLLDLVHPELGAQDNCPHVNAHKRP